MRGLNVLSGTFVEQLYDAYVRDPDQIPSDWRQLFDALERDAAAANGMQRGSPQRAATAGADDSQTATAAAVSQEAAVAFRQARVDQLVRAYREQGHLAAKIDPLGFERPAPPVLDPSYYGFTDADMHLLVSENSIDGPPVKTLGELIERLQTTYCRSIGVEFMHIHDVEARQWLQERMESTGNRIELSRDEQLRILTRLTDAVIFEEFIREKYVGAKSFSLEGAETLIPLLDLAIEHAGEQGIDEIVFGMAHRGRLNVLANILGKHPQDIFREFEDMDAEEFIGRGDVKYHLGHSGDWVTQTGRKIHLSMSFNPSHLEFVNPVALGRMRAKQDRFGEEARGERGLVVLIHGDAAFAGEGIVQETLNLSGLGGYTVGGALHIIVNNQIGFVTPPEQGRSTTYATDVAKMLQSPIFHVNGEDPEAVAQVVRLALDFRRKFRRDVVIDMYAYRRLGHNEGDEPSFTQPLLYDLIRRRPPVRESYLEHLLKLDRVTREEADQLVKDRRRRLEEALSVARQKDFRPTVQTLGGVWTGYRGGPEADAPEVDTTVPRERLVELLEALVRLPEDFNLNPKLRRFFEARRKMATGEQPLNWAAAEALAFASLAVEGCRIRMTGQDSERGTFSHRHAVLHDVQTGAKYMPLQHLAPDQAPVEIHNSPLSEAGVLGFEYGYSLDFPDALVLWEAQFGDFANTAQVIIDQFLTSAEEKWNRLSGLVLLLPHGFEGQGPEHSSARLERYLALTARDNIQVVNATTPAQYFHVLRRQALRTWRKPLIIMAPKSLLRHPRVTSTLDELATGGFRRVLPDEAGPAPQQTKQLLLCTGKVYYDLLEQREELGRNDVAIVRLEQLYPFPHALLHETLAAYPQNLEVRWVQEEPANMGAWPFLRRNFGETMYGRRLTVVARPESASPGTGSFNAHKIEQARLLEQAFA